MNKKNGNSRKKSKKNVCFYGLLSGFLFLSLILVLKYYNAGFFQNIELKFLDLFFQIRGTRQISDTIAIIAIDEKSIGKIGRWPWRREKMAELVDKLTAYQCDTVVFDIVFSESQTSPELKIITRILDLVKNIPDTENETVRKIIGLISDFTQNIDSDDLLANSIKQNSRSILGIFFFMSDTEVESAENTNSYMQSMRYLDNDKIIQVFESDTPPPPGLILSPVRANLNIPAISEAALGFGYFNVVPDADGAIRRIPLVCKYNNEYYQSLSLRTASAYLKEPVKLYIDESGIEKIRVGDKVIPTDISGKMTINYAGPSHTFNYICASDVIDGTVNPDKLKGKIAVIGITATGLYDIRVTPYSNIYPGVEIHANAAQNIIDSDFINNPWWSAPVQTGFIILTGILISAILPLMGALAGGLFSLASVIFIISVSYGLFSLFNIWFSPFYTLILVVVDYLFITSTKFFVEEKERRFIKSAFGQYLSVQLVNELVNDPSLLKLGGEEKILTVLFSDIAGFTSISEKLAPTELVELLNDYTTEMSAVIMDNRGTIDKYNGDAIMAFFGAPVYFDNHAACACKAVLQMQKTLDSICARIAPSATGTASFYTRIGVNTGKMVVGNMGSKNKFNYTVLGDSVNLASRLEGANKFYNTRILIGENTQLAIDGEFAVRLIDIVKVKGKTMPEKIFELIDLRSNLTGRFMEFLSYYDQGMNNISGKNWKGAVTAFSNALSIMPADTPSKIHLSRCEKFIITPPDQNWDGSYSLENK